MFTQVELVSQNNEVRVYWLEHGHNSLNVHIAVGRGVKILEENPYFRIRRVFTTLNNRKDLPVKSNVGTIVELN
jgi:hypothetical protein